MNIIFVRVYLEIISKALVTSNKSDDNSKKKKRACTAKGATPLSRSSLTAAFLKMKPQNWGFLENNSKA